MSKVVAIHQPNFLPWLGYFHKMNQADAFVLLDDVQFSKGSYGNRVKIKSRFKESVWLTVPVHSTGKQAYNEIQIAYDQDWRTDHANLLRDAYQQFEQAPYFDQYFQDIMALQETQCANLAELNILLTRYLKRELQISTTLYVVSEFEEDFGIRSERLLNICKRLEADVYLSGQGARAYNDEALFSSNEIQLVYQNFNHPVYPQLHGGEFVAGLSVIDLLFNCGPDSARILTRSY